MTERRLAGDAYGPWGGGTAVLGGVLPTPAVSRLVPEGGFAGGAVISASHNPYHDNGIKLLSAEGAKLPDSEESALEKLLLTCRGAHTRNQVGIANQPGLFDPAHGHGLTETAVPAE